MSKGYFFTVDALIAIILIIIFSSFMVISNPATDNSKVFDNYTEQTTDASFVGYYLGKDATQFGMTSNLIGLPNEYCSYNFDYDIGTPVLTEIKYCKGGN